MALNVTSAIWQQVNTPALDMRRFIGALITTEGVSVAGDLAPAQRAAGANMSTDIPVGQAVIKGDAATNQGYYYVWNDAVVNLTGFTAAHATLPRIDRVAIRVRDSFHGEAANDVSFQILTGTATSGATLANLNGALAVPGSHLLLANILIPALATSIITANIDTGVLLVMGLAAGSIPAGTVNDFAGANAPQGWLLCDGTAVSRVTYAALFTAIGTVYGVGDGSTTFNLPDARGRMTVGRAPTGGHADVDNLGENDGVALANRRPKHRHTVTDAGHSHAIFGDSTGNAGAAVMAEIFPSRTNTQNKNTETAVTGITVGAAADSLDAPPYIVLTKIIKT
jgi:microcystin-dependent protein